MSILQMSDTEIQTIDSQVEKMMDWAKSRQAEAEQLAMDSARLMACTGDRLDRIKNQGFFKRCWYRFAGKTGEMERANTNDLISMQKMAFRYVNMLQEQQLLMAHSLLALKNNLVSLAVKEEETRHMIGELAQRTLERFESLESRVDQLEISTNLQGWLLGLEERDYDEKFPTDYMRLFRVINDFYQIKKDEWNYNDLIFMRKAIRTVGLNPKQKISLNTFIDRLVDEIQSDKVGFDAYGQVITQFAPKGVDNYSKYALENVSSPVFAALHGLKTQYQDRLDMVEELQDEMNISVSEALKRLLRRSIKNLNVDMDYEVPLDEIAIEIIDGLLLINKLINSIDQTSMETDNKEIPMQQLSEDPNEQLVQVSIDCNENNSLQSCMDHIDVENLGDINWQETDISKEDFVIYDMIVFHGDFYMLAAKRERYGIGKESIGLYRSHDLSHMEKIVLEGISKDVSFDGFGGYGSRVKLKVAGSNLFYFGYHKGNNFVTSDGTEWIKLDLPEVSLGTHINYENALFNGINLLIDGSFRPSYSYYTSPKIKLNILNGLTIDEKKLESQTFGSHRLLVGKSLNDLTSFTFADEYFGYEVTEIIQSGEYFYTYLWRIDRNETIILKSQDGIKWDMIPWDNEKRVHGLLPCKEGILISCASWYIYDTQTHNFNIIEFPQDAGSPPLKNYQYFSKYTLYSSIYTPLFSSDIFLALSNNLNNWKSLPIPYSHYGDKHMRAILNGNRIFIYRVPYLEHTESKIYYGELG